MLLKNSKYTCQSDALFKNLLFERIPRIKCPPSKDDSDGFAVCLSVNDVQHAVCSVVDTFRSSNRRGGHEQAAAACSEQRESEELHTVLNYTTVYRDNVADRAKIYLGRWPPFIRIFYLLGMYMRS